MSHEVNSQLLERAAAMIDIWEGTIQAKIIEADLERNDLESLAKHVMEAEDESFKHIYQPEPIELSDAQLDQMAQDAWKGLDNAPF